MLFYVLFDIGMAVIMFAMGFLFYKSNGKAANLLTGYNMKPNKERKEFDEIQLCKDYGKRMMYMAVPFLLGTIIDIWFSGIGCLVAWGLWVVMFILLLFERHKREQ